MGVKDMTGTFRPFQATRSGEDMTFTYTTSFTSHNLTLMQKFDDWRRHNGGIDRGRAVEKCIEMALKDFVPPAEKQS